MAKEKRPDKTCGILRRLGGDSSRTADYASGLWVIGSLLLSEADSLAHYQIAQRGYEHGTTEYIRQFEPSLLLISPLQ